MYYMLFSDESGPVIVKKPPLLEQLEALIKFAKEHNYDDAAYFLDLLYDQTEDCCAEIWDKVQG